ncbi:MAG: tRNA lysidine(34) synthetase TilS, partial [Phenylobacterium sp.]
MPRRTAAVLDRRLLAHAAAPLAVAYSGGGDSLALLMIADAWARRKGRPLIALHVDHGLQPQSRAWAERCAAVAAGLGAGFRRLAWDGDKPLRGLPAAARGARHRLIADAAREAGARIVLFGHTADDLSETLAMQAAGSTTPLAREWAPSPVWPEGRGLFLLRPLLGAGRAEIRDWLLARRQEWIDDPANENLAYARARARGLGGAQASPPPAIPSASGLA